LRAVRAAARRQARGWATPGTVIRKVEAINKTWNHVPGTITTPEKFEARRLEMAWKERARLRADTSRECGNGARRKTTSVASKWFLWDMHRTGHMKVDATDAELQQLIAYVLATQ
jgi:nitrate/TMAO reductase-like tetraheme cytochrome c subunit